MGQTESIARDDEDTEQPDMDFIATTLRYPDIMFPRQNIEGNFMRPLLTGALRIDNNIDNIRFALKALSTEEKSKRRLTIGNDVQSNIVDFAKLYNGFQSKNQKIRDRTLRETITPGLGPTDFAGLARMLNSLYNETTLPNGQANLTGFTLPPFIFLYIPDINENPDISETLPTTELMDWSFMKHKINVNIPGYVCLGDILNPMLPYTPGQEEVETGLRAPTAIDALLMFARQELCLVGTGTLISDGMINKPSHQLYMLQTDNPMYMPMGVFFTKENNVAVLKCAFKTKTEPAYDINLKLDAIDVHVHRVLEYRVSNAFYKVLTGSENSIECCRTYKDMIGNCIKSGIEYSNNEIINALQLKHLFPNATTDVPVFFKALCNLNPTISGYLSLCDCIKPFGLTLESLRTTLGLTSSDTQDISFACDTNACINRNKEKVINLNDKTCPKLPEAPGINAVQFYTTRITGIKSEVLAAALAIDDNKNKATVSTTTADIVLVAKNNSTDLAAAAKSGADASDAALAYALLELGKLTTSADQITADALIVTAQVENAATRAAATRAAANMASILDIHNAYQADANYDPDAIFLDKIRAEISKITEAKESASKAADSAVVAKADAVAATTNEAAVAAIGVAKEAAQTALLALDKAKEALANSVTALNTIKAGSSKTTAMSLIFSAKKEVTAIENFLLLAEDASKVKQSVVIPDAEPSPNDSFMPTLKTGEIVGIVMGIIIVLAFCVSVAIYLYKKRKPKAIT